jgi:hypothetical protein
MTAIVFATAITEINIEGERVQIGEPVRKKSQKIVEGLENQLQK